jgi:molybdopterin/thiamine biosynthesis adenylyltransferase
LLLQDSKIPLAIAAFTLFAVSIGFEVFVHTYSQEYEPEFRLPILCRSAYRQCSRCAETGIFHARPGDWKCVSIEIAS